MLFSEDPQGDFMVLCKSWYGHLMIGNLAVVCHSENWQVHLVVIWTVDENSIGI